MLWSVIKIVVFIALVAAAAFGASALLELDGGVRIEMLGQEFNLTPLMAAIGLIVIVLLVWLILKLTGLLIAVLKFINGDDTAMSRYFDRNRQEKGYRALSEGMMALASGDGDEAMAKAARAERFLKKPELTNLITAQAAEVSGNKKRAMEVYKTLLGDERTRFVGVRGILRQKLEEGDTETALKLAEKAFALKPKHVETQDTLLQLQADQKDWSGARETLNAKLKHGSLPRDVHRRRDAVLALSEARDVVDGDGIATKEAAIEANRLSPDLIPAAVMAAKAYINDDAKRYATRVLQKAWAAQPHPDLAATFAEIEPEETPAQRLKRFKALLKKNVGHRENKLLEAELQLAAEDFPAARRAIADLVEDNPDARTLAIMAAVERGEGAQDKVVRGWLARAVTAQRGPQWVCNSCHHIHSQWGPTCENCNSFDTLSWTDPPESEVTTSTGTEMLPLIMGLTDETKDQPEEAEIIDDVIDPNTTEAPEEKLTSKHQSENEAGG